ncbi:MAG: T9SS type A sorting domain-containing protein [Bacteroidota bacterium]
MNSLKNYIQLLLASAIVVLLTAAHPLNAQSSVNIIGPSSVTVNSSRTYSAQVLGTGTITKYEWVASLPNGGAFSSNQGTFSVYFPNTCGNATISLKATIRETNGSVRTNNVSRTVFVGGIQPPTPGPISGPTGVCGNNSTKTYSIGAVANANRYTWTVSAPYKIVHPGSGALVSSYTGTQRSINVRFPSSGSANGTMQVFATNTNPCPTNGGTRTLGVKFGPQFFPINGPNTVQRFGNANFSVTGFGTSNFSWTLPQGFFAGPGGSNNSSIQVGILAAQGGWIYANYKSCGVNRTSSKFVNVYTPSGGGPFVNRGANDAELEVGKMGVYPNPAQDNIVVSAIAPIQAISIVNTVGQLVKTLDDVSGIRAEIDISDLEPGSYYIMVLDEQEKQSYPLVVE